MLWATKFHCIFLVLHYSLHIQVVDDMIIQTDKKTNDLEVEQIVDRTVRNVVGHF